jgi:lysophospholipase L1-like esterase
VLFFALLFACAPQVRAGASFADFDARAKAGEHLNVVFFGASLTWGANATDPQLTSFRGQMADRLRHEYPDARFRFWDAAIGGTGSQLGVFRLDRDVLRRKPDLVFLDFSANDGINTATPETLASYESLVRRIISEAHAPVVQVIFPFMWDVARGNTDRMLRHDAHLAIAAAYHTAVGDAIALAQQRVKDGKVTIKELWPIDGVHPGDRGYELFTDAAWDAFRQAVKDRRVCAPPDKMLHAAMYMTSARVRLSSLGELPRGWHAGRPNVVSAYFDMLMSRWLDDEVIASNGKGDDPVARLRVHFRGTMVMLFGESTTKSCLYRAYIDGKPVERHDDKGKPLPPEFDAGWLAKRVNGNTHLVQVLAEGLKTDAEHTLEIEPIFTAGQEQELRLESICVAGPHAAVR